MARDFKIELDNVEMINGSDDLLKDTKVTKVTLTGENKLNSLNSTFENCTELTAIEGDVNLDGVSDMTEMTLNTPLDELKVTNPTEKNIQTDNSLNQVTNVKIGGTKYAKGGIQDIVGSLEWNAENFTYEDTILDNVYTNSSSIEESKNITVSDTLEQKATSIEITGQTYENLVDGKSTENLLDEMSMQQTEGKPTQFTPHIEQPICLEYIEGETYQNLIEGKGEYKLTDTFSTTWTESNNRIENPPSMVEIPEIFGNTVQGFANVVTSEMIVDSMYNTGINTIAKVNTDGSMFVGQAGMNNVTLTSNEHFIQLKPNTEYSVRCYSNLVTYSKLKYYLGDNLATTHSLSNMYHLTTDSSGKILIHPETYQNGNTRVRIVEGQVDLSQYDYDEMDLNYIQSVGDLYVDESGEPILDEEGNEQYKLEIISSGKNICPINTIEPEKWSDSIYNHKVCNLNLKSNTTYTISCKEATEQLRLMVYNGETVIAEIWGGYNGSAKVRTFTTGNVTNTWLMCYDFGLVDVVEEIMIEEGSVKTEYEPYTSNKTTILMPQPLMKFENSNMSGRPVLIYDKLYKNLSTSTYFVDSHVIYKEFNGSEQWVLQDFHSSTDNRFILNGVIPEYNSKVGETSGIYPYYNKQMSKKDIINGTFLSVWFLKSEFPTLASFKESLSKNPLKLWFSNGDVILRKEIKQDISLETYSPKTYISTNSEIQPSQMTITNKKVDFIPLGLQPNKDYTLQLDSVGKNDKPITVNLGGTETTIQPINDASKHHKVVVTTPSELTTDKLELSGEGVVVNDVMLFEGNTSVIKQDVDYIDGIQSIGELIENKNLFDYTQSKLGFLSISTGGISSNTDWKYTTNLISVKPNTTYCISQPSSLEFYYNIVEYNSSQSYLKGTSWEVKKGYINRRAYNTLTTSTNTYYIRLSWKVSASDIQLEEGLIPTEFTEFGSIRYKIEIETYNSKWDSI